MTFGDEGWTNSSIIVEGVHVHAISQYILRAFPSLSMTCGNHCKGMGDGSQNGEALFVHEAYPKESFQKCRSFFIGPESTVTGMKEFCSVFIISKGIATVRAVTCGFIDCLRFVDMEISFCNDGLYGSRQPDTFPPPPDNSAPLPRANSPLHPDEPARTVIHFADQCIVDIHGDYSCKISCEFLMSIRTMRLQDISFRVPVVGLQEQKACVCIPDLVPLPYRFHIVYDGYYLKGEENKALQCHPVTNNGKDDKDDKNSKDHSKDHGKDRGKDCSKDCSKDVEMEKELGKESDEASENGEMRPNVSRDLNLKWLVG
ncbi:hypothetical protein K440DRAFT_641827 [Wilcoxina mikolae CBS 423.85]|nr:hypothetical protein K440DRAFT_641827 [Wilcoxina mikolae CBS 423.85]